MVLPFHFAPTPAMHKIFSYSLSSLYLGMLGVCVCFVSCHYNGYVAIALCGLIWSNPWDFLGRWYDLWKEFYFFLLEICIPFISFSCVISLVRISSVVMNRSRKQVHPYLVSNFREKESGFSQSTIIIACVLSPCGCFFFLFRKSFSVLNNESFKPCQMLFHNY